MTQMTSSSSVIPCARVQVRVDDVMNVDPCYAYPRTKVENLWDGAVSLSPLEIAELPVPVVDRLWVLFRVLPAGHARLFAAWAAQQVCHMISEQPKLICEHSLEIARMVARDELPSDELDYAAQAANWCIYRALASDAAKLACAAAREACDNKASLAADRASRAACTSFWSSRHRSTDRTALWITIRKDQLTALHRHLTGDNPLPGWSPSMESEPQRAVASA